jgi:hypothetical protein
VTQETGYSPSTCSLWFNTTELLRFSSYWKLDHELWICQQHTKTDVLFKILSSRNKIYYFPSFNALGFFQLPPLHCTTKVSTIWYVIYWVVCNNVQYNTWFCCSFLGLILHFQGNVNWIFMTAVFCSFYVLLVFFSTSVFIYVMTLFPKLILDSILACFIVSIVSPCFYTT